MSNKSIFTLAAAACSGALVITAAVFVVKPQAHSAPGIMPGVMPTMTPQLQHLVRSDMPIIAPSIPVHLAQQLPTAAPTALPDLQTREDGAMPSDVGKPADESNRCIGNDVWFLPVRDAQFRVTARFGYHASDTPYFTLLKAKNLLAESATQGVFHGGVDLKTGSNAPVFGVASGRVLTVAYSDLIGKHVIIELDQPTHAARRVNRQVVYGHLNDIFVVEGQSITCGQVLGISGSTGKSIIGAHLHFEVREQGHAVDPMPILKAAQQARFSNGSVPNIEKRAHALAVSGVAAKP